jgi:L,D-transpeptidase YcbB
VERKQAVGMKKLVKGHAQTVGMLLLILVTASCSQKVSTASSADKQKVISVSPKDTVARPSLVTNAPVMIDTLLYPFRFETPAAWTNYNRLYNIFSKTKMFYERNNLSTKWLGSRSPNGFYFNLIDILKHAELYGLNASDYNTDEIEQRVTSLYKKLPLSREVISADIALTKMYFLFTSHLSSGRISNPAYGRNVWIRYPLPLNDNDVLMLAEASAPDDLLTKVEALQPTSVQYSRLRKALITYKELDEFPASLLPGGTSAVKIKPGEKHSIIPLVRRKLLITDLSPYELPADTVTGLADSMQYDPCLIEGVKQFQARHGLTADGIIGERTLKFLDQSFKSKAAVIAVNMERLRWMPAMENDDHYIEINIPEYMLRIYDKQKEEMSMRVIVGSTDKPTPVFTELLEHLIFSPTWTVPTSIIREEIIPRLQQNPAYYSGKNYQFYKNNLEIDPAVENWNEDANPYAYRIVQLPGADNSLGRVKFVMPNSMNVYLHDTPNHRLFSKDYRALSHGCIRLSDPTEFAAFLLRDQRGWEATKIDKAMNSDSPTVVHLKTMYKVYTSYRTAWVDDTGVVNFREDIYGYDRYQLQLINPQPKEKRLADRSTITTPPVESL